MKKKPEDNPWLVEGALARLETEMDKGKAAPEVARIISKLTGKKVTGAAVNSACARHGIENRWREKNNWGNKTLPREVTTPKLAEQKKPAPESQKKPRGLRHDSGVSLGAFSSGGARERRQGGSCLWPIDNAGDGDFHYCGVPTSRGQSYCVDHRAVAYEGANNSEEAELAA